MPPISKGMRMTTLDDLNTSGLLSLTAEGNRDISLSLGVYQGNVSFTIFVKGNPPTYKVSLNHLTASLFKRTLRKVVATAAPGKRMSITLRDFDGEQRKWNPTGTMTIGIDDNNVLYLEPSGKGLSERQKFPVRIPGSWDFSNCEYTEREIIEICAEAILDIFNQDVPASRALTRVKRKPGQGGGGNRNGGGGYNRGGNSGGGYNNNGGGGQSRPAPVEEEYFS